MQQRKNFLSKRFIRVSFLLFGAMIISTVAVFAGSPANLTTDILWTDTGGVYDSGNGVFAATFAGSADIEAAFNNARRQEETQLSLTANSLGTLTMPSNWSGWSDDDKMLWLLNQERTARAGMAPGVIGLEFEALETNIDALAQGHADYLNTANTSGHSSANGDLPHTRIDKDAAIGNGACNGADGHEFVPRSENIASFWTSGTSNPLYIERAIYNWIYADAGSSWGHREAALLQDAALGSSSGFTNNFGSPTSEGFIGVGVVNSATYNPSNFTWSNMGTIVVLNFFDPIADPAAGCAYAVDPLAVTVSSVSLGASASESPLGVIISIATVLMMATVWIEYSRVTTKR